MDRRAAAESHSSSVARYASAMAEALGWEGEPLALMGIAGMLHDLGKAAVPDHILRKPGALSREEAEAQIKSHPVVGADLVGRVDGLAPIVPWIRHSHEHFDGSGYPDGLRGDAIPLGARILLVAAAFSAMTGNRPYRSAVSTEDAMAELRRNAGRQFDPACVQALEAHLSGSAEAA